MTCRGDFLYEQCLGWIVFCSYIAWTWTNWPCTTQLWRTRNCCWCLLEWNKRSEPAHLRRCAILEAIQRSCKIAFEAYIAFGPSYYRIHLLWCDYTTISGLPWSITFGAEVLTPSRVRMYFCVWIAPSISKKYALPDGNPKWLRICIPRFWRRFSWTFNLGIIVCVENHFTIRNSLVIYKNSKFGFARSIWGKPSANRKPWNEGATILSATRKGGFLV